MKKSALIATLAGLLMSGTVAAGPKYGPAGCGLGSMLIKPDTGMLMQVLASTTNGTSNSQTFGITSGTSNCELDSGDSASTKTFIATNRVAMSKDIARGQGEMIDSVAELAGCNSGTAVGAALQSKFNTIFPNSKVTDAEVGANVVRALQSDATLACVNLG